MQRRFWAHLSAWMLLILPSAAFGQTFKDADALLDAVETADAHIERLSAGLSYHRLFALAGDEQLRIGHLTFLNEHKEGTDKRSRKFAVVFDDLYVGERKEPDGRTFVFDGEWLIERIPADRLMLKRQVAPPGAEFDPLRVGEGPLPLPLGQKKADILANYQVTMPEPTSGIEDREDFDSLKAHIERLNAQQIHLLPKGEDENFEEIRLWYAPSETGVLPCMAMTVNRTGDEVVVMLINVKLNADAEVDQDAFEDEAPEGWDVDVTPYRS